MNRKSLFIALICSLFCLTGCADVMLSYHVSRDIAPSKATLELKDKSNDSGAFTGAAPDISILKFEDKRTSKNIVRNVEATSNIFHDIEGLEVFTNKPVDEIVTDSIQARIEKTGIRLLRNGEVKDIYVCGEIREFNLDTDRVISTHWTATVELMVYLKSKTSNMILRSYMLKQKVKKTDEKGAKSGVEALQEALDKATSRLRLEGFQLTAMSQP